MEREPRAALILNRFTRNLSIMFATNAVSTILGLQPGDIKDKSFYDCIQENCLQDAIRCLESAKANESIAYLRFWFRDPRAGQDQDGDDNMDDGEEEETDTEATTDSEGGGAVLYDTMDVDSDGSPFGNSTLDRDFARSNGRPGLSAHHSSSYSDGSPSGAFTARHPTHAFHPATTSLASGSTMRPRSSGQGRRRHGRRAGPEPIELEAVVSCTSDGLVVVLRRARPAIPAPHPPLVPAVNYENGLFAAPWGQNPIRPQLPPEMMYMFRPPLMPEHMPLRESVKAAGGPPSDQLMRSIRDVAVFAWALVGINGNLAEYGRGAPRDRAQPDVLPIWDPQAGIADYDGPENLAARRWGKMPVKENPVPPQVAEAPALHYSGNLSPLPLEPSPQSSNYTPLQPSSLDHYTYSSSSTWTQSRPSAVHSYQREDYQQPSHRDRPDPFSPGPAVLPPLQFQHSNREPHHQAYQPAPSHAPISHILPPLQSQQERPFVEVAASHTYQQPPAPDLDPAPPHSAPVQGASINTLRYLWQ
jgi:hypothetical protein